MISMYFGKPGSGKSTLAAKIALEQRKNYQHIYCNMPLKIDGVTHITDDCIGKYELENCLLIIDEASLFADNRDFKNFNKNRRLEYFLLHRHRRSDIILLTQGYNCVDKKLRMLTVNLFYIERWGILGHWFSTYYPIAYGIHIPESGEKLGEIIEGYRKPSFLHKLFTKKKFYRPNYYSYFDSYAFDRFPDLPSEFQPYHDEKTALKERCGILGKIKKAIFERRQKSRANKNKGLQAADISGQSYPSGGVLHFTDQLSGEPYILRTSDADESGEFSFSIEKNSHTRFDLS